MQLAATTATVDRTQKRAAVLSPSDTGPHSRHRLCRPVVERPPTMTVCITGDVHHMSLGTRDQSFMDRSEVDVAREYASIAAEHGVPVTLFCTGKAAAEEADGVRALASMDNVEIGGHNYWAFDTPMHTVSRGLLGTWNGPRWFQNWEINRTVAAFREIGIDIRTWRDHAYRHDGDTAELLAEAGITHFSDRVGPDERLSEQDGVRIVPINTPPDHEHVYHAFRTPEFVESAEFSGPFGSESHDCDDWLELVLEHADAVEQRGGVATVLAHPSCMHLADGLTTFEDLVARVADRYGTVRMSDLPAPDGHHG